MEKSRNDKMKKTLLNFVVADTFLEDSKDDYVDAEKP
jgi:hypothetical protein